LREIADLGARQNPPFRFAFENLCWGTYNDTWAKAWAVVEAVDRDNFGLCLDTYNIAGREFADPEREDGMVVDAERVFKESMKNMVKTIDVKKVFYVQVVDAERLARKMDRENEFWVEGQKPRMSWSRNCRLFLCEEERGGYLPVVNVLKAICGSREEGGMGYNGWVSMELFNRSLLDDRVEVPMEHAVRAVESWKKTVKRMGWEGVVDETKENQVSMRKAVEILPKRVEISARL
jgi:4-hydroxyphenylpyruvate dioxygenase